jgi:hypothetical protein
MVKVLTHGGQDLKSVQRHLAYLNRKGELVHKILFSMPAGTPPKKVLEAVKDFAREEFALKHRYAMVLHTDEPHPHVHMVVKGCERAGGASQYPEGTLRGWRQEFARHLRTHGVEANATERAVRGNRLPAKLDGIYRAEQRGESHHTRTRAEVVARELLKGDLRIEQGKARLLETRKEVERGWFAVSDILMAEGREELAHQAWRFAAEMRRRKWNES